MKKNDEDAHLENAASALQYAEEEVQRLEEEKAALLEYIEEHSAKENNLFNDIPEILKFLLFGYQNLRCSIAAVCSTFEL